MSDDKRPPEGDEPEVDPQENHDGTAPTPEEAGDTGNDERPFMPVLRRRAEDAGLDPDALLERVTNLSKYLQDKADREDDAAETNKATARNRMGVHLKALVFVLGGGMVIFGASSELLDLSGIDLGLGLLPTWLKVILVAAIPSGMTFFGWHELTRLRASFIKHQQERLAFGAYQQEVVALNYDCPLVFDGSRHKKHRPTADAVTEANPSTMRLFWHYRAALVVTSLAVTACLVALAIMA